MILSRMRCAGLLLLAACSSEVQYGYRKIQVSSFSHRAFDALLHRYVSADGRVDYASWKSSADDLRSLDEFVNLIANASPASHPSLFPTDADRLAYWINGYNALVLRAVLEHWPIRSVNDVQSGVSFVQGQGFFHNRKYLLGGESMSLLELENRHLRGDDPRTHFAINCASGSCPPLRPSAYDAAGLDALLDARAREFINREANVYVSREKKTLYLSRIFEWYREDFLKAQKSTRILDYLRRYADPPLADKLKQAESYRVEYLEYDWGLNRKE
jgi:hypothetical protein